MKSNLPFRAKRASKRLIFRAGTRVALRDPDYFFGIPIPRTILKTPRVKGRRLAMKKMPEDPAKERAARKALIEFHKGMAPESYTLALSKRYPPVRGKRTEIYYDRPSLEDLLEKRTNRRVKLFLEENHLSLVEANSRANEAFNELQRNVWQSELKHLDFADDQFIVDSFSNGKLNLICIDL